MSGLSAAKNEQDKNKFIRARISDRTLAAGALMKVDARVEVVL